MAEEPNAGASKGGWWSTLPGILTAIAAIITALTGFFAILAQNGVFGEKNKPIATSKVENVAPKTDVGDKPGEAKSAVPGVPASDGAASGIAASPLHSLPFTGAVVAQRNGKDVKPSGDVKEYCQGRPVLKTPDGQLIEMKRMSRFDVVDWRDQAGTVRITLNNGETVETKVEGCAMVGSNDLGDYHGDFDSIKSVTFIR
jgi:hypothetical protein